MSNNNHPDKRAEARKKRRRILELAYGGNTTLYDTTRRKHAPEKIDDTYLREHADGNIRRYSDKEKTKVLQQHIKGAKKDTVRVPDFLPNTGHKLHLDEGCKRVPTAEDFRRGVSAFLLLRLLFPLMLTGYYIAADLLIALRLTAIRRACRGALRFVVEIRNASVEQVDLLAQLISLAVTKHRWRGRLAGKWRMRIHRDSVLDYRDQCPDHPYGLAQFSKIALKHKGRKKLRFFARYADTPALVVGANSRQIKDVLEQTENAVVWLVNSTRADGLSTDSRKSSDMDAVHKGVLPRLIEGAPYIRAVLHRWWEAADTEEDIWAADLVRRAKDRLKRPESDDYIALSPNLAKLRHALRCEVLLSFVAESEQAGFLATEKSETVRGEVENAFYPQPAREAISTHIEDPNTFLDLMRKIVSDKRTLILNEAERFVKRGKTIGAIRSISGTCYLVMPEKTWATEYRKTAKAEGIDTSFCEKIGWERDLQRILGAAGKIKTSGSNPRYRYDLHENGTKDSTYVVAVPWDTVKPDGWDEGKDEGNAQDGGQDNLPSALPDSNGKTAT